MEYHVCVGVGILIGTHFKEFANRLASGIDRFHKCNESYNTLPVDKIRGKQLCAGRYFI